MLSRVQYVAVALMILVVQNALQVASFKFSHQKGTISKVGKV
jgi:hypothetical protein